MLKMVDGTGIIGVDMVCPLGGAVSPPQPPNYDKVEMEGVGSLMLPNSLKAPLERVELIGNSTQGENPAPDNPQEIKSAGRKSKNLFNKNTTKQGYEFGAMLSDAETIKQGWFVSDFMPVKATTYYISGKATGSGCKLYDKDKVFVKNMQVPFGNIKFDEGIAYFRINGEIKDLDKIQVEEGTVATDYEPYGYLLDVKVTGKNLFNLTDNYIWGWFASYQTQIALHSFNAVVYMPCKPNTTYTIYGRTNVNGNNNVKNRVATANDFPAGGTKLYNIAEAQLSNPVTITTDELSKYLVIMAVTDNECNIDTREQVLKQNVSKMMVITGNAPTPYEPYTEQSVQIALDEPLRGIGEYKDVLTKDGVVRKIKRVVLDGSEDEEWRLDRRLENHINFALVIKGAITVNTGIRTMMDKFKYLRAVWNNDLPGQEMFGAKLRINMPKTLATDLQTFKTWLSQNPLTVDYVLAEPVTEPLPESVQQQLQTLHSENGTTHVFVDSGEVPCGIKLTYRKEI